MTGHNYTYPLLAKILHAGIATFGIAAFLTGENAEGGANSFAYLMHAYLGLSLAAFILLRVIRGAVGSGPLSFSGWSPVSSRQWQLAWEDICSLIRFKVPVRGMHEGIAGLTQAFGLIIFAWMAVTGTGLFLLRGGPESELFEFLEEFHEVGEMLIPLYLLLHVGSVLVHSFAGSPIWQKMWKFRTNTRMEQADRPSKT